MTLEDLRDHGVLLPEDEWGEHRLETTARQLPLAALFLAGLGGLVLAVLGDGGPLTWAGVGGFLFCFFAIVWLCDRAVLRQRRRFRRERGRG